ncbi:MAG: site-specific DNA-methyltransferase [Chloroflexi bacterium]|nr:site-specific DNA-methyltransferase [Chloroflexota bacterium]MCL5075885.1 site-specific DNA-methyltransferase [Chloroflexota bacterium]
MNQDSLSKFQDLLRTLFQFDCADLDFGIYRILNYKRGQVEAFIQSRLPQIVDEAFAHYAAADKAIVEQELEQKRQEIIGTLGEQAIDESGQLRNYHKTRLGQQYLQLFEKRAQYQVADELKARAYNDLYTFFSRYYEDGDFISKRRYGRHETYAIPYSGEEVVLYWANRDQYYVKTGERFKAYRFKVGDYTVAFELRNLAPEQNGNAGKKRYFVLAHETPVSWNEQEKALAIAFEYRPLTESEEKQHGKTEQQKPQDSLNEAAEQAILTQVTEAALKTVLARTEKRNDKEKSALRWQLDHFTRKNTADFFIHKDLRGFLRREVDFFIKNEVLLLDELIAGGEEDLREHVQRGRVVRQVAEAIIDFLAQVEDFQKKLFEKKKFVVRTEYCLTLDRVPEELWDEVLANEAQLAEWRQLYALDDLLKAQPLMNTGLNKSFLKAHPTLVVDTRHFPEGFKWRLLAHFEDLDEALDGLLIKSENWQALNLLLEKYREKVKCIYIDPPYNTGSDEFIYKDRYQHSSWLSMMTDRLVVGREALREDGVIFVSIDDNEFERLKHVMDIAFGGENWRNLVVWHYGGRGAKAISGQFPRNYDFVFLYSKSEAGKVEKDYVELRIPLSEARKQGFKQDEEGRWFKTAPRGDYTDESITRLRAEGRVYETEEGNIRIKYFLRQEGEYVIDEKLVGDVWFDIPDMMHSPKEERLDFDTQKPEKLLDRIVKVSSKQGEIVLDFFVGSGTACAGAHKACRRWIGVDFGEFFENKPLERMKKVIHSSQRGGFFKYQYLEQYEDALNNLELPRASEGQQALEMFGDEYLLKYMLDFETQGSPCLLNLDRFKDPFAYKLKVQDPSPTLPIDGEGTGGVERPVDLVETFNYLLGIQVKKVRALQDNGRPYRAVLGEKNGKRTAIVWRSIIGLEDNDKALMKDKRYIEKTVLPALLGEAKPDRLLVNGACFVKDAEAIEPEFKRLMFAPSGV